MKKKKKKMKKKKKTKMTKTKKKNKKSKKKKREHEKEEKSGVPTDQNQDRFLISQVSVSHCCHNTPTRRLGGAPASLWRVPIASCSATEHGH